MNNLGHYSQDKRGQLLQDYANILESGVRLWTRLATKNDANGRAMHPSVTSFVVILC